ncbi:MAG: type I methionyl aminopeptidase [Paenibacillus macerans]|uniref:Methionine aminopeptidase n=1 Tax=Paenibacillus macerans TaxID=44252 RepID=A0A090ZEP0_PAEMA|nr:type I methionyl aminopeptidase [Paenibacillus macerans]KFN09794.1 methionine aminopeptidase, type I [Paenibacillus macerans]MCY7560358.1 type I methionyl aminopeptidase [Paenibacillus macerans]MDU7474171.1 type I methionyl aminopeptidase [Paenibacillus macerans]MEC0154724.1 type I methionyl aminopeptidase [Paenibacillus macerans]MEC0331482.1 type I methionyl aminopeptidase [Paenibacillus macerans]
MIILKSPREIEEMKPANQIVAECHREVAKLIQPGITTQEINDFVARHIVKLGGKQFTKGYNGFPAETCASVNDVVAHGFPSNRPLQDGDLLKLDIVVEYDGWFGDSCWCYAVGEISPEAGKLMKVTKECMELGIAQALPGNRLGDVTSAIQKHAEEGGFSVVRDLLGHGVGRSLHEEPNYEHIGVAGKGIRLKEGMVFTVEPMINEGTFRIMIDDDGWTARTADGKLSAQFEHTIAVTADGPLILTAQ